MEKERKNGKVLVVDDEQAHAEVVAESLKRIGYDCSVATTGRAALKLLKERAFDVVVTDLIMEGPDGMAVMKAARDADENTEVILITAYGSVENAVQAMEKGAYSFLTKPINIEELRAKVKKAAQKKALTLQKNELQRSLDKKFGLDNIIGNSAQMQKVFDVISQVAATNVTVLIQGPSIRTAGAKSGPLSP